jgi:hypothetical protein
MVRGEEGGELVSNWVNPWPRVEAQIDKRMPKALAATEDHYCVSKNMFVRLRID